MNLVRVLGNQIIWLPTGWSGHHHGQRVKYRLCEHTQKARRKQRADNKSAAFEPYVLGALDLIRQVVEGIPSSVPTDEVLRAAVGVLGDLASSLGPQFKGLARTPPHREYLKALIKEARASPSEQTKQVAQWANQAAFSN